MKPALVSLAMLLGAATSGCGIQWMRHGPLGHYDQQLCVETALRRNPDPATLASAYARFEAGCQEGDAAACSTLGVMYERGLHVKQSVPRAVRLYDRACKGDNGGGCVNLGMAYKAGAGVEVDAARAAQLFEMACERGDVRGCTELASVMARGQGIPSDARQAAELFETGCSAGHADACYRLASYFEDGTFGPDPFTAMTFFEKACIAGISAGCERLDQMYDRSRRHAPPVPHPAEIACRSGDARACNAAGLGYFAGDEVARNLDKAVALMQRACEGGYTASCDVVGPMLHGSCARGDGDSCVALAKLAAPR